MSSSTPLGGDNPGDESKAGMGKYVRRLKTVLRRGSSSRQSQVLSPSDSPATPSKDDEAKEEEPQTSTAAPSAPGIVSSVTGRGTYPRNAAQQERAQALFAKYGLTLEAHEWLTTGATNNVQRVEKPIRMRVHRNCHRCQTAFGVDRTCVNCQHRRCQKCPRYPAKKDKTKEKKAEVPAATEHPAAAHRARSSAHQLTLTTRDGKERARVPIKQRVRRTCHHCSSLFNPPTRTDCEHCHHVRCVKCPRDPVKSKKYPNGYPGDAPASDTEEERLKARKKPERTWRKPRQRVRWSCEQCQNLFREGHKTCGSCGHQRGVDGCVCTREPPKKVKKEPDPEVVKSLEEKLASFKVGDQTIVPTAA